MIKVKTFDNYCQVYEGFGDLCLQADYKKAVSAIIKI